MHAEHFLLFKHCKAENHCIFEDSRTLKGPLFRTYQTLFVLNQTTNNEFENNM